VTGGLILSNDNRVAIGDDDPVMGLAGQTRARVAVIDSRPDNLEVEDEVKVAVAVGVLNVAAVTRQKSFSRAAR
jgi:hypothetical protein